MPGARCTRGLVCKLCKEHAHEHTGPAESIRPSLRNGFTTYIVLSPVNGFLATVIPEKLASQELDASTAASGPHDFAVRSSTVRQRHLCVHRIPPHVRDDREPPLSSGETGGAKALICPSFARNVRPEKLEGAGNAGCALHRRSRVQNCKKTYTSIQVQRRQSDIPRAMVLRLTSCSPR